MSKRIKYHFNPELLRFERIQKTALDWFRSFLLHSFTGISMGLVFFGIYLAFFETPDAKKYREESERLQSQYKVLQLQTKRVREVLTDLQERDDNLYRAILQADPIPKAIREGSFNRTNRYASFDDMDNAALVKYTTLQVDALSKMAYTQSKSYDVLIDLVRNEEARLLCIPSIQPIMNKDLKAGIGGFGWRVDPVYHVAAFHSGMDFTSPTGTKVYATGEGRVALAGWKQGYGNCIIINHGYNFQTLYGHLSRMSVQVGQKVVRGDVIGAVGATGKATGPHLHYEVHYGGKAQNPAHYFYLDLSPKEYDQMIRMSSNYGRTMD